MFARSLLLPILISPLLAYSQNTSEPIVVCVPGQCLQGYTNVTIGTTISAPGFPSKLHLLPGRYDQQTNPQYLHDVLTSSSVSSAPSTGFPDSTQLPLDLQLQNGLAIYSESLYAGQSAFTSLPDAPVVNASVPLAAKAIAISNNLVASVTAGSDTRLVLWDSVPDISQLPPSAAGALALNNLESVACSPACAGGGICTASGTCKCSPNFTGSSCEQCLPGFFGPNCQACPSNCESCDEGISGTGRCLKPTIPNAPSTCNCVNGVCGANGQCQCTTGFETAANGQACAKCADGFFLTSTGDCKACGQGCQRCSDTTGACLSCKSGFVQDNADRTKCSPPTQSTQSGQICPSGSFASGNQCVPCDNACETCSGSGANACTTCTRGQFLVNGVCVGVNSDGICAGTNMIADNLKRECDSCGAKCTSCRIPDFTAASTVDARQCTGCVPGSFLSNGNCVEKCPDGTFVDSDNLTCRACDSSCGTCSGSANFCVSCRNNQLASNGRCVSSCPSFTFSSSGSCLTCHPDCSSCSGGAFNQCTTCPPNRPVLVNSRCLPTCTKTQYFDTTSGTCQSCDSSCSSCSGPGSSNCLACSSSTNVLRQGRCVSANCEGSTSVVPGLGVCLSELVVVPKPSGTSTPVPLPTVTGLETPTAVKKFKLEWWQILLMALGCAFIFILFIWCCRRRQKKKRAAKTTLFAAGAVPNRGASSWRWKLIRWGEKLFGHRRSTTTTVSKKKIVVVHPYSADDDAYKLNNLRAAEEGRPPYISPPMPSTSLREEEDMVDLIGSYNQTRKAPKPADTNSFVGEGGGYLLPQSTRRPLSGSSQLSAESMYSQMTGMPQRVPDPRQPVKRELTSKFSMSTLGSKVQPSRSKNPFWK